MSSFLIQKLDTFVQFYQSITGHLSSNSFTQPYVLSSFSFTYCCTLSTA